MLDALPCPDDFLLAQKCLEGEEPAIAHLQETYRGPLVNYLIHAGASPEEARDLVDEFWADCLAERPQRRPRLATYAGNSPLQGWLKAVALNNLIQLKRHEKRMRQVLVEGSAEESGLAGAVVKEVPSGESGYSTEQPLLEIMRGAVESAFRQCDPQDFVLLQLAHTNGLLGRELALMFSCSEAKISRDLEDARRKIVVATLSYVQARDPWLELKWEDFVDLCRVVSPACFGVE
jgi:RNA polymerase sigma factor (sigma-70 family)